MANPANEHAGPFQDPAFQAAMTHMHKGEWQEAIRGLEAATAHYPDDPAVRQALDEARFKADFDAGTKVRPKRWAYPWQRRLVQIGAIVVVLVLLWQGTVIAARGIGPLLSSARERQARAALLAEAQGYLQSGNLDAAEKDFQDLLARDPSSAEAQAGLAAVTEERTLDKLYRQSVALQDSGDCKAALDAFTQLALRRSSYRDVDARVKQCSRTLKTNDLIKVANTHYELGLRESALDYYHQIYDLDANFQRDLVTGRIAEIELQIGRDLLASPPVPQDQILKAQDHFRVALQFAPRLPDAVEEQQMVQAYLDGSAAVSRQEWGRAIQLLSAAFEKRPAYLGGALVGPLYDAYLGRGDEYQKDKDCALAYEQYRKAAALPGADVTAANARLQQSAVCLTPTPTVTPTPLPTAPPPPSATPSPTPTPLPLASFRGQIVFKSEKPEQPGFWAMNPDGANRQFVGSLDDQGLQKQYDALIDQHRLSPDGQSNVYVGTVDGRAQVKIHVPRSPIYGDIPDRPLTRLTGIAYDPVWAPDGSWIAFVTQEDGSDDVWVIRPDSSGQHSLVRNTWEWDKHPSWSPDSTQLAFMSNRAGTQQIFVMDVNGRNVRNISNVPWNEYDPIWIR